jgi:type IV secretory pathway component VirB8
LEQKFEDLKNEDPEHLKECFEYIKESVKDGSYFKDATNWYFFRYISPVCERTLLSIAAIISCVICYSLYVMIDAAFPLVQKDPIIIRAVDQSKYFPNLIALKPKEKGPNSDKFDPLITTIDEAVIKYLISYYIKEREGFDFSKAEIDKVNNKFSAIKNNSSSEEYRKFQIYMSKENPQSPILNFGVNVKKEISIISVKFIKEEKNDLKSKAKDFIANQTPTKAEIRFNSSLVRVSENGEKSNIEEKFLAKIDFSFSGVEKKAGKKQSLGFLIKEYQLYKVQ